jgi:hypothetical protein
MTLAEVAEAVNLTVAQVIEELDLPPDVSPNERIGRLLRRHDIPMSDLMQKIGAHDYIARKETEP